MKLFARIRQVLHPYEIVIDRWAECEKCRERVSWPEVMKAVKAVTRHISVKYVGVVESYIAKSPTCPRCGKPTQFIITQETRPATLKERWRGIRKGDK